MKKLERQLVELLNIHAVSSKEKPVRDYLKPVLKKMMDKVFIDDYGNLLGEKTIGNGQGASILLSAHMDTVKGVLADKKVVNSNGILMADKGALGADDRAGIAIILSVLRNITKLSFNGKIKVAFSREEEVGCVGASRIDKDWYSDTDLAIVVDRRGNRDIVAGCGGAFCSDSVGLFMEEVSKMIDMDWKCVEGGISDAMVFADNGINSINLSAGYMNEHTEREFVVVADMKDTVRLILQVFAVINQFYKTFEMVGYENRWSKSWYKNYGKNNNNYQGVNYYEDEFLDDVWAEEHDSNGDIYAYELGSVVIIQQNDQELVMSRESLRGLLNQLKNV